MTSETIDFRTLAARLPRRTLVTRPAELITYEADAGLDRAVPAGVVFPESAEDVTEIVRWAVEQGVPLIARGAGTGISGGAVAERGGLIVEFSRMDRILELSEGERRAVVQPGVVNRTLDEAARRRGLYFPPDPASGSTSTIGGNIAENAGGPHCFKYGVTANYVLGLDVVLADGRRVRLGGPAADCPEYDLTGLVTGSEGMLAIITAAIVRLIAAPSGVKTTLAAFPTLEAAGQGVSAVIARGLVPATMEMMDQKMMRIVEAYVQGGLPVEAAGGLIIEVDGWPASLDPQMAEVVAALQAEGASELRVAESAGQREEIWRGRRGIGGAVARLAPAYYSVDVTVPRSKLAWAITTISALCEEAGLRIAFVLHAGDGNFHPDILVDRPDDPAFMARVYEVGRRMVEICVAQGGTITGEHGVGIEKRPYMRLMFTEDELDVMREIKAAFDPQGVFNPGKMLPEKEPASRSSALPGKAESGSRSLLQGEGEVYVPASAHDAADLLAACCAAEPARRVRIRGGGTKSGGLAAADVCLSTERLRGIAVYAPDDLYVTAGAGTRLDELQSAVARGGRYVPLVSPWDGATLGGIVAANFNAPLRLHYGAIRDLVLAMTVALPDGRVIRAGRPLVKNVAGYDMPKLFVGAHGTLGLIVDVTLKLVSRPRARRTLVVPVEDLAQGLACGAGLLRRSLVASAVLLCSSSVVGAVAAPYALVYTAEGLDEEVAAELAEAESGVCGSGLASVAESSWPTGSDLWAAWLRAAGGEETVLRVGVTPGQLREVLPAGDGHQVAENGFVADLATGLLYVRGTGGQAADLLRQRARAVGGYAVTLSGPHGQAPDWCHAPGGLEVMQAIKRCWDPKGTCNPGAFLPEIAAWPVGSKA